MERLFESFIKKLAITNTSFVRSLMNEIEWEARLIGIKGARGVGKTTLLLQYIKLNLPMDKTVLYASVDNIWFSEHKLYDLASLISYNFLYILFGSIIIIRINRIAICIFACFCVYISSRIHHRIHSLGCTHTK